ncbi:hypothetical protein BCR44DRAFT_234503 [Catenaria anguillulae PL171]|uniref:Secreted protein n=1 Tax=Catenaria anguillulae PL171 TaxID=765915 RepID=A0A1Y2H4I3_9FUNG|nr:hypothetical protein BCR44DRAFT_234503 [Catenaria anguillulae PL171]
MCLLLSSCSAAASASSFSILPACVRGAIPCAFCLFPKPSGLFQGGVLPPAIHCSLFAGFFCIRCSGPLKRSTPNTPNTPNMFSTHSSAYNATPGLSTCRFRPRPWTIPSPVVADQTHRCGTCMYRTVNSNSHISQSNAVDLCATMMHSQINQCQLMSAASFCDCHCGPTRQRPACPSSRQPPMGTHTCTNLLLKCRLGQIDTKACRL